LTLTAEQIAARYPTTAELLALHPREQHPWVANAPFHGQVTLHPDYRLDGEHFEVADVCNSDVAEYIAALPAMHAALIREAAEVARLKAEIEELQAALANEQGKGTPPAEGWVWEWSQDRMAKCWQHRERRARVWWNGAGWTWQVVILVGFASETGTADYARDAMRAALAVGGAG